MNWQASSLFFLLFAYFSLPTLAVVMQWCFLARFWTLSGGAGAPGVGLDQIQTLRDCATSGRQVKMTWQHEYP